MSAAGLILAAGNKRLMGSRSWFMYHEISMSTHGTVSELEEQLAQVRREMQEWARSMAEFTTKSEEFWEEVAHKHDFHLNAKECLSYGVIDELF